MRHHSHFVAACVFVAASITAQKAPADANAKRPQPAAAIVQSVSVAPGALRGHILASGTKRPVAEHSFTLLDNAGKQVGELKSAADGTYTTPELKPGAYSLIVRDDLRLDLTVANDAKVTNLDIVLPQGPTRAVQDPSKVPAAPGGAAPGGAAPGALPAPLGAPGLGVGTWAVIGGGAAAAVAVPVVASNSGGGGSENPVSTSGLGVRR